MDVIEQFTANLKLDVDISFINMPTKHAVMTCEKGKPTKFSSDDFVMIPKRGLDFTLNKLFEYPFITVDRGTETRNGKLYKVINVIPTDKRADFSIATLLLDTVNLRITESEINTKKDGTYILAMKYENEEMILPNRVEVSFEIEQMKIPLNFVGKGTDIDRKKMHGEGMKTGKIFLQMSNYRIKLRKAN
ncbi:hypothetical protein FLJC2902T_30090 [Flavobacterium limnosediminis JC2902]|uniref:Uncharacterized protein n=2 Tax=Flavobacterium TaxID=237 RepID=V6SHS7_9FLAO|nr:hypothetical protein FLJC2902T_30090 [Flavobacterium limnosediminis JC2902]